MALKLIEQFCIIRFRCSEKKRAEQRDCWITSCTATCNQNCPLGTMRDLAELNPRVGQIRFSGKKLLLLQFLHAPQDRTSTESSSTTVMLQKEVGFRQLGHQV